MGLWKRFVRQNKISSLRDTLLFDKSNKNKEWAANALFDIGEPSVKTLCSFFDPYTDPDTLEIVVKKLNPFLEKVSEENRILIAEAIVSFVKSMSDSFEYDRHKFHLRPESEAITILGEMKYIPAVEVLNNRLQKFLALNDPELRCVSDVCYSLLTALSNISDPSSIRVIADCLGRSFRGSGQAYDALVSYGQLSIPVLAKLLQDPDAKEIKKNEILRILGDIGHTDAVPVLLKQMQNAGWKGGLVNALERIGWQPSNDLERLCFLVANHQFDEAFSIDRAATQQMITDNLPYLGWDGIAEAIKSLAGHKITSVSMEDLVNAYEKAIAAYDRYDKSFYDIDPVEHNKHYIIENALLSICDYKGTDAYKELEKALYSK